MVKYNVVRNIATIKSWGSTSLELKVVKWGNNPEKYDLRKWEGDFPGKGITLTKEDLESLFNVIGEELELFEDDNDYDEIDSESDIEVEEIDYRSFFVHGNGYCGKAGHNEQEDVIAVLKLLRNDLTQEEVELRASFCQKCNAYYIAEDDYLEIASRGRLLCQLMSDEEYRKYKNEQEFGELKPQSILNIIGYNVNAKKDISDAYRQKILAFAIESKIVTKKEVVNHLGFLIKMNESNPNFDLAIEKWRRDRAYIAGYTLGKMRVVGAKRIIV